MQKYIVGCVSALFLFSYAEAFVDVPPSNTLYPALKYLVEKDALEDQGFFRGESNVQAEMFWPIVIVESGFNPNSATFKTPLPSNVDPSTELAQILREAVRRDFISAERDFDFDATVTQGKALRTILEIKGIVAPKRATSQFRQKVTGLTSRSSYFETLEAAYASGIIEDKDLRFFPHKPLQRKTLARWLYNHDKNGNKRESTINPNRYLSDNPNRRSMEPNLSPRRTQNRTTRTTPTRRSNNLNVSNTRNSSGSQLRVPNAIVFEAIYAELLKRYRFADELSNKDKEALIEAAIGAMVKELGDKYTSYIEPTKVQEFTESLNGQFEGIGAYVDMIDDQFTITSPIKGSPAEAAGLMPGDIVTKVDGETLEELTLNEIVNKVKGPAGSKVTLTVYRDNRTRDYIVTRGKITIPALTLEFNKSVPIISLNQFNRNTGSQLQKLINDEVLPKNPKGLVIDLRNNPGGFLSAAVKVGDIFTNRGQELFSVEYNDKKQVYKSDRDGELKNMTNIVVLVNKGTASASEILAGLLQDYDKAYVIGEQSLGKGTVQEVQNYTNGGILKLTVAKWLTPKGRWVHEKGITPDSVMEPQTAEDRRADIDRPLDRAVQYILGNR